MSTSTRFVLSLFAWLVAGMGSVHLGSVAPSGWAWWLLMGAPAALVVLTLAAIFAVAIGGLFIALTRPASRR